LIQELIMGIASFSPSPTRFGTPGLSMLLAPLQALAALFMPVQPAQAHHQRAVYSPVRPVPHLPRTPIAQNVVKRAPVTAFRTAGTQPPCRLKVMREFEPGMGRSQAGRMAISGRMADVCAELERIALRESAKA
jgi:hypothetical protein